ncbi:MAG: hypothetical protein AAFN77_20080 [Planctomycetota bacterium]
MKKELPIASGLLAFGLLLWFAFSQTTSEAAPQPVRPLSPNSQSASNSRVAQGNQSSVASPQENQPLNRPTTANDDSRWVHQSLPQQETNLPNQSLTGPITHSGLDVNRWNITPDAAAYFFSASDPRTVELLSRVAKQTADSKPIGSALELRANLFDQKITAAGKYFQAGQGSHQSRLELSFGSGPQKPTIFQMCDGRFIYRLETFAHDQSFKFVDLKRIQEQASEKASTFSPTGWVATGELSSLYQHLASAFNFGNPQQMPNGELVVRGSWNQLALKRLLTEDQMVRVFGEQQAKENPTKTKWDAIPPQLPHGIELVLAPSSLTSYFPRKISFVRFQINEESKRTVATPVVQVSFSRPMEIGDVHDRMFVIDSKNVESTDVTENYIARVREFEEQRFAQQQLEQSRQR